MILLTAARTRTRTWTVLHLFLLVYVCVCCVVDAGVSPLRDVGAAVAGMQVPVPGRGGVFLHGLAAAVRVSTSPATPITSTSTRTESSTGTHSTYSSLLQGDILYSDNLIKGRFEDNVIFKSYCNSHFCKIRRLAGISESHFAESIQSLIPLTSHSKSGQNFWKSKNGALVVKTMPKHESKTLRRIIEPYTAHISDANHLSCISTILGMYSVTVNGKVTYVMACKNVFPVDHSSVIKLFDIKGSTVGRKSSTTSALKKDLDALAEMDITNKPILRLAKSDQNSLLAAVERDITFLKHLNLMDYSLLIGVEGVSRDDLMSVDGAPTAGGRDEVLEVVAARKRLRDSDHHHKDSYRGKVMLASSRPFHLRYHLGIVDFLQIYTPRKKLETITKGLWYDSTQISAVDANSYANRFYNFIKKLCDT